MALIWGSKGYSDHLGYIIHECPACHQTSPLSVYQIRKKFTLYFIPTFSYSNKQFLVCEICKASFEIPDNLKKDFASIIMSQQQLSDLVARAADEKRKKQETVEVKSQESNQEFKKCPYCAEEIRVDAIYCRFCHHDLIDK